MSRGNIILFPAHLENTSYYHLGSGFSGLLVDPHASADAEAYEIGSAAGGGGRPTHARKHDRKGKAKVRGKHISDRDHSSRNTKRTSKGTASTLAKEHKVIHF